MLARLGNMLKHMAARDHIKRVGLSRKDVHSPDGNRKTERSRAFCCLNIKIEPFGLPPHLSCQQQEAPIATTNIQQPIARLRPRQMPAHVIAHRTQRRKEVDQSPRSPGRQADSVFGCEVSIDNIGQGAANCTFAPNDDTSFGGIVREITGIRPAKRRIVWPRIEPRRATAPALEQRPFARRRSEHTIGHRDVRLPTIAAPACRAGRHRLQRVRRPCPQALQYFRHGWFPQRPSTLSAPRMPQGPGQ